MNYEVEFLVNNKIEIEMEDDFYKSNIQDVSDNTIGISIPVNNGKYLPLKRGEKVICSYIYKKNVYVFESIVVSRKIDRILIIDIKKPEQVKLYQRRNFVRIPFMIDVLCAVVPVEKDVKHLNNQVDFFNAISIDLSGGGMKLSIDSKIADKLYYGSLLMITIPSDSENITVRGKIARIDKNQVKDRVLCGVSFIDLDETNREKIISIVFKIMRDQIKKGTRED